ncbi:MAG: type II toxin-antitoxin system RelE/ParE family toxin [Ottowia sp.]|nr:type II toxin-antitoxin system RelE/ParE family toxin [Ottowia sp.]
MKKSVRRSARASEDIEQASHFYAETASRDVAERFLVELTAAFAHISEFPATGSQRYAARTDIAGLRFWTLKRFPFAVFYLERNDVIDVLRVLHQASDLPRHFS